MIAPKSTETAFLLIVGISVSMAVLPEDYPSLNHHYRSKVLLTLENGTFIDELIGELTECFKLRMHLKLDADLSIISKAKFCSQLKATFGCCGNYLNQMSESIAKVDQLQITELLGTTMPRIEESICSAGSATMEKSITGSWKCASKLSSVIPECIWIFSKIKNTKLSSYTFVECHVIHSIRDCFRRMQGCKASVYLDMFSVFYWDLLKTTPCDRLENHNDN